MNGAVISVICVCIAKVVVYVRCLFANLIVNSAFLFARDEVSPGII
ncbi:hypothetical protein [Senimuribacter intestinalis]|nr:hypothetical protein [Senimuribacter intestinalis]